MTLTPSDATNSEQTAEQRLKAREDFFRLLSHEIRTPLNGLMGMLDLLSNTPLSPDQKSYLGTARDSGGHLLSLVNDFLDYARIDAGHITLEPTDVRLEPLLQGVAELLSPRAYANQTEIVWSVDPRLLHVRADEGRLRQILFNLAGNAIKFTHAGGVCIHVGLTENGHVRFTVSDTGEGIPEEARARIFEEFGQVNPLHNTLYGGAGLGLVVVKKLVEAMQGTLTLVSEVGKGSAFTVELQTPYGLNKSVDVRKTKQTVTLITGNTVLLEGAQSHLAGTGISLRHSTSVEDVFDPKAIILCDRTTLMGPVPARSPRSLILLAPEQRDEIEDWRKAGWAGYLIKPLRRQSLLERIRTLCDVRSNTGEDQNNLRPEPVVEADNLDERVVAETAPDKSVLLVEDNPVNALLAQILLQREGCRVERATSGEDALTIVAEREFDLILMDLGLPGLDGLGTTRELRAKGVDTPIVALTANAYEEDRRACLAAGMNDFLTKPIEVQALRTRLHNWVRREKAA